MRRSKSNPSKYAKNYRRISQRQMSLERDDDVSDANEAKLMKSILEQEQTLKAADERTSIESTNSNDKQEQHDILSKELKESGAVVDMIVGPKKKKKKTKTPHVTSEELLAATKAKKADERKLKQLQSRKEQAEKRSRLYEKLAKYEISAEEQALLQKSSHLDRKGEGTKKQKLKRALQFENAGLKLSEEQRRLLYVDIIPQEQEEGAADPIGQTSKPNPSATSPTLKADTGNYKKKKKKRKCKEDETTEDGDKSSNSTKMEQKRSKSSSEQHDEAMKIDNNMSLFSEPDVSQKPLTFAEKMMANMKALKAKTDEEKRKLEETRQAKEEAERQSQRKKEEEEAKKRKKYVPVPIEIDFRRATSNVVGAKLQLKKGIVTVDRPEDVQETRMNLPVCEMEYEIVEAVKANDTVIICGETGSGKSTQVPQFLYEAGLTGFDDMYAYDMGRFNEATVKGMLVGVTQPRRVAAVSTAKRIAFEMGCGDGQEIKSKSGGKGNLVAYQTRYETAGLGSGTRIKFMTDGILLSEIQEDLLLRKYSSIVLDEAHERNLNTDVLLGLLSKTLPLRRKAALEGSIPPLKLIIMSATLRVDDFTANSALFPSGSPPTVVKVPGRTYPVTIHHSKVTELDDYETAAFKKVCKIHRKLPQGGILVFLTGKQEIVQMVKRLKIALSDKTIGSQHNIADNNSTSINIEKSIAEKDGRDMDDDEIDAECFDLKHDVDDFDQIDSDDEDIETGVVGDTDLLDVTIYPLHSMLSIEEQARVFAPVPEGHRLIVVATNIAETSITIPGISYVVDCGRQKTRNYHASTGIASYDIMWVSKAAADQRAGRAGRTGPGHCYRIYSSSVYERQFDQFALPEVLTRPLEDVVLAMKTMNITNVETFPFATPPDINQIKASLSLLARLGCVDVSNNEVKQTDGLITKLGRAVSRLPLSVRYAKMLLIGAQANVLDYTIAVVAALSEHSPFLRDQGSIEKGIIENDKTGNHDHGDDSDLDEADRSAYEKVKKNEREAKMNQWSHPDGDILSRLLAVGAFAYAGLGAGGISETNAQKRFCEENGLSYVVMNRIHKLRLQLAKLAHTRLRDCEGIAAKTGKVIHDLSPPNRFQEATLKQVVTSGLLDNIARLAPFGMASTQENLNMRIAYLCCSATVKEPIFIDRKSQLFSNDRRKLPEWVCYDSLVRKKRKDGSSMTVMNGITSVDASTIALLSEGSSLQRLGEPLTSPAPPTYNSSRDAIMCNVETKFGCHEWIVPSLLMEMREAVAKCEKSKFIGVDETYRWFARFLLEGKIISHLTGLEKLLNDAPAIITRKKNVSKVGLLVSSLASNNIDSASRLKKHWSTVDKKFLFKLLKSWVKEDSMEDAKKLWINAVNKSILAE